MCPFLGRVSHRFHSKSDGSVKYSSSVTTHTDYYGYPQGAVGAADSQADNEKWVTYKDINNDEIELTYDSNSESYVLSDEDLERVAYLVVWGFNYPKQYLVSFKTYGLSENAVNGIYFAQSDTPTQNANTSNTYHELEYFYNERVGIPQNNESIDGTSGFLTKYGIVQKTEETGAIKVVAEKKSGYEFYGWYEEVNGKYEKVSSYDVYGDRITKSKTVVAGYRKTPAQGEASLSDEQKGVTVTKNETEHYVTGTDVDRVRYVTQINTYGFDESDPNFQSIVYVYVKLPTNVDARTGNIVVKDLLTSNSQFQSDLKAELDADRTQDHKRDLNTSLTLDVIIDDVTVADDANTICYTYDIVPTVTTGEKDSRATDGITANEVVFTNKNRTQFVFDVREDLVAAGTANSNLVFFTAIKYKDTSIAENEYTNQFDADGGYVYFVSDNYVVYDNNEHD